MPIAVIENGKNQGLLADGTGSKIHHSLSLSFLLPHPILSADVILQEFVQNQERLKPTEEKNEEERVKVEELRGSPMVVGTLEEVSDTHTHTEGERGRRRRHFYFFE
jgi:hypothetical protein